MPAPSRRSFVLALVIGAVALALCPRGHAQSQETIAVGFSESPPMSLRDKSGVLRGFAVSSFAAAADLAGLAYKQDIVSFGDLLPGLTQKRFDVVVMSPTPERRKAAIFTEPLASYGETLVLRSDDPTDYASISQLKGRTVGSNAGGGWITAVREAGGEVKTYPAAEQTLAALESGEVQAVVGNAPTYRYLLQTGAYPKSRVAPNYRPVQVNELSFALRPEASGLRDRLNQALQKLRETGAMAKLRTDWGF